MFRPVLMVGLALAGFCAALDAAADDQLVWHNYANGDELHLIMGVPESDNQIIDISCARGSDAIKLRSLIGSDGLKAGDATQLTLANNRAKAVFNGRAVLSDETTGIDVQASGKLAEFQAIIKTGRPFVLEVKGAKYGLAPDRIEKPLATLASACKTG
jgi:selenocysteine-specific translation elongation factor